MKYLLLCGIVLLTALILILTSRSVNSVSVINARPIEDILVVKGPFIPISSETLQEKILDTCDVKIGIKKLIKCESKILNLDEDIAVCIAEKESSLKNVKNKNSSAGGIFQIIDSTWKTEVGKWNLDYSLKDKYSIEKNIFIGLLLMKDEGIIPWTVWKSCTQ